MVHCTGFAVKFCYRFRRELFGGTVPSNNLHRGGTVPSNNLHRGGTVPPRCKLFDGTPKLGVRIYEI